MANLVLILYSRGCDRPPTVMYGPVKALGDNMNAICYYYDDEGLEYEVHYLWDNLLQLAMVTQAIRMTDKVDVLKANYGVPLETYQRLSSYCKEHHLNGCPEPQPPCLETIASRMALLLAAGNRLVGSMLETGEWVKPEDYMAQVSVVLDEYRRAKKA